MLRSEKIKFVSELESIYQVSNSIIVVHYHGLTVLELTILRRSLRSNNASLKVVKNTLSKIAASSSKLQHGPETFSGPTAIIYSDEPISAAKTVVEFAKANNNLKIISGIINDEILDVNSIQRLAELPPLDYLRGRIVGILQAPSANLARVLQEPASMLARVINSYVEKTNN